MVISSCEYKIPNASRPDVRHEGHGDVEPGPVRVLDQYLPVLGKKVGFNDDEGEDGGG